MKSADYDFDLPPGFIAERPASVRDEARLLVLGRGGEMEHCRFSDLPSFLKPGDMLVMNDSRVLPARISGTKPTGGRIDFLLVEKNSPTTWQVLSKDRYSGKLVVDDSRSVQMEKGKTVRFESLEEMAAILESKGQMPLPPYIRRKADSMDRERYQTVYAENDGSIAAPTAGLHFTEALIAKIRAMGVAVRMVTLHVGIGTFRPVQAETVEDHQMHREHFAVDPALFAEMAATKERGGRVITVGTTATRTVEGYLSDQCSLHARNGTIRGTTDIFIREGYRFRAADGLITNFHLPRSTPLMLAAAFSGRQNLLNAYKEAISRGYRFFSYGDAMLLL